jgi:hypothetical protein
MTGVAKVWSGSAWVQAVGVTASPQITWPWGTNTAHPNATQQTIQYVQVAPNATAHTKGAWTPIIASTPVEANMVTLIAHTLGSISTGAVNSCALGDIGIGPSGSEQVLVANIGCGNSLGNNVSPNSWDIPINVPAGSQLSFRWQAARDSGINASVAIQLGTADFTSATFVDTLGADTATTTGTEVGNGTITLIVASAARAYRGFVVCPMNDDAAMTNSGMHVDVAIGPESSETLYRCTKYWTPTTAEALDHRAIGSTFVNAPCAAGQRIAVRVRDGGAGNWAGGTKNYNVVLLGVPA